MLPVAPTTQNKHRQDCNLRQHQGQKERKGGGERANVTVTEMKGWQLQSQRAEEMAMSDSHKKGRYGRASQQASCITSVFIPSFRQCIVSALLDINC